MDSDLVALEQTKAPVHNLCDGLVVVFCSLEGFVLALFGPGDSSGHDLLDLLRDPLRHLAADALRARLATLLVTRIARAGVTTDRLPDLDCSSDVIRIHREL